MTSREWAIELVERQLLAAEAARSWPAMVVIGVERHALGWLISCQSPEYARTGLSRDALAGHGPFLVDALDGSLHMVHAQFCDGDREWEDQYRQKVRGDLPPRELDARVRQLTDLGRRGDAFRAVRRAPGGLSPADALRFVDAIASGSAPPADLVYRLPQPDTRYPAISTYSGPNPEPADWWPVRQASRPPGA
ncbi:YrhB domain-containing protein [Streptomyces sp. NPDC058655]|uniref:YrhB domain-containing protein n=1 Tax=Streptomyces sp. NPDC058655 TaxID=3346577 RepID=UPI0036576FE8